MVPVTSRRSLYFCLMTARASFLAGALLGLTGVALGALGAHNLRPALEAAGTYDSFLTGTRFQLLHALLLLIVALWLQKTASKRLKWASILATLGTLLFSGSIYLLTIFGIKATPVVIATPLGGTLLIVAWALLAVEGYLTKGASKA